jgi:hypothetical protein
MQDFLSPLRALIEEECLNFDKIWQARKHIITTRFLVIFIFFRSPSQMDFLPKIKLN